MKKLTLNTNKGPGGLEFFNDHSDSLDFLNDKQYHLNAKSGHLILSSSNGSEVYVSGTLDLLSYSKFDVRYLNTASLPDQRYVLTSSDVEQRIQSNLVTSGTFKVQSVISNYSQYLILSSAVGSIVAFSSSLDFPNTDKNYHIRAVNGNLILSSSVNSIVAFSSSQNFVNTDKPYHIRAINSDLILSSSATSIIALSSALDITNVGNKNYQIRNPNGHLILSSSIGSRITASGSLLILSASVAVGGASVGTTGDYGQLILSNPLNQTDAVAGVNLRTASGWNVYLRTRQDVSWLELTTGQGVLQHQWVATNYNLSGAVTFLGQLSASIVAKDQHLILSSSAGSRITVSGGLNIETTNDALLLPRLTNAQKDALTPVAGMMIYNSDSGSFQGYTTAWKIFTVT